MQYAKIDKRTGKVAEVSRSPIALQPQDTQQFEAAEVEDDAQVGDSYQSGESGQQGRPAGR